MCAASAPREATAAGTPASKGATGSGTPITPVEAMSTSCASQPSSSATICAERRATARPGSPVAALALPELSTTARARPRAARSRLRATGAAPKRLVVKAPATTQASSATTRARSRRLGFLRNPAETPEARTPAAAQTPPSQGAKPYAEGASGASSTQRGSMFSMWSSLWAG